MEVSSTNNSPTASLAKVFGQDNEVGRTAVVNNASKESNPSESLLKQKDLTQQDLEAFEKINTKLDQLGVGVSFSFDKETSTQVVKLIDKNSNEVMKQFPNEEALKMLKHIQQYLETMSRNDEYDRKGLTGALISEII